MLDRPTNAEFSIGEPLALGEMLDFELSIHGVLAKEEEGGTLKFKLRVHEQEQIWHPLEFQVHVSRPQPWDVSPRALYFGPKRHKQVLRVSSRTGSSREEVKFEVVPNGALQVTDGVLPGQWFVQKGEFPVRKAQLILRGSKRKVTIPVFFHD